MSVEDRRVGEESFSEGASKFEVGALYGSKAGDMSKRQKLNASSSSSEVDFVRLCEDVVQRIQEVLKRRQVLYPRVCSSSATQLSNGIVCIREAVEGCWRYKAAFVPLLAALHRYYEKVEALVNQHAQEDWCAAAVFLYRNFPSFLYILDHIETVGEKILESAKKYSAVSSTTRNVFSLDVRVIQMGEREDQYELRKRLQGLASEGSKSSSKIFGFFLAQQAGLRQQHLAQYLLRKETVPYQISIDNLKRIMWEKEKEPAGTWGDSKFLGEGAGANGVWKTSWLGVPCAKKEFHGEAFETIFEKEALIMTRICRHPCIVDFICCGNGEGKGERFIAMELMEKSLFDLIKERKGVHFSLDVALDIMWQIADGVKQLHNDVVAHRDLKPQNVVVKTLRSSYHEDYYCVKVVDFGSYKSEVEASTAYTMSYRGIGTTSYRAPEAHPSAHPQGLPEVAWRKADAYSFSMTCAHVLTLTTPFDDLVSMSELYTEILRGRRPILPSGLPKELVDLVEGCWSTDLSKRPAFAIIYRRLETMIFNRMLVPFSTLKNSMVLKKNNNVGMHDIKEEQGGIKEEGHTSYATAQDASLCSEVVSERDSKLEVSKLPIVKLEF